MISISISRSTGSLSALIDSWARPKSWIPLTKTSALWSMEAIAVRVSSSELDFTWVLCSCPWSTLSPWAATELGWILRMWSFSRFRDTKAASHIIHRFGLSPVCWHMWRISEFLWRKSILHTLHMKSFSVLWTCKSKRKERHGSREWLLQTDRWHNRKKTSCIKVGKSSLFGEMKPLRNCFHRRCSYLRFNHAKIMGTLV